MEKDLEQSFSEEIQKDADKAMDLYRALCDNIWVKEDKKYAYSWRTAGWIVAEIRNRSGCPHEDYMDYYLSGGEGEVAPWLQQRLEAMGYELG